ncbi:aspartate/glutamate racemase family protein, partial [Bordetella pertussis]
GADSAPPGARWRRRPGLHGGRIGLMGTSATLALGLYQQTLQRQGYSCIIPEPDEVERYCMGSIRAVKANRLDLAYEPAAECIAHLKARGADAVVLGCTELPLAVPHALRPGLGIRLTDSIDALALAAIEHYEADQQAQKLVA